MTRALAIRLVIAALVVVAVVRRRWRRRPRRDQPVATRSDARASSHANRSVVLLVATREIRQRLRGRVLKVSTLVIMLAVVAAIVLPTIRSHTSSRVRLAVVAGAPASIDALAARTATALGLHLRVSTVTTTSAGKADLTTNRVDLVVTDHSNVIVARAPSPTDTSPAAQFVRDLANELGTARAVAAAGLTPAQADALAHAAPVTITALSGSGRRHLVDPTSIIGIILTFVLLSQYDQWILTGVMEEKSSRVIEVLLATVKPLQLIAGKVLGIGAVALAQGTLIVTTALVAASAVGSSILHGTAPWVLASSLLWLVLGYVFYSWVFAAAGSMAERMDQAQSLVFPLTVPLIVAYVYALSTASSGNASLLFKVLAYFPPTALFAMPTLVGLHAVSVGPFLASVAIDLVGTYLIAQVAATVYRRAILRTGGRVRWRDLTRTR